MSGVYCLGAQLARIWTEHTRARRQRQTLLQARRSDLAQDLRPISDGRSRRPSARSACSGVGIESRRWYRETQDRISVALSAKVPGPVGPRLHPEGAQLLYSVIAARIRAAVAPRVV